MIKDCPSMKIIQLNTDGIMVSFDLDEEATFQAITKEWEDRTGFELEEDFIQKIVQKDVNNYIEIPNNGGSPKCKGEYLVRGISEAGAFKINNNATIIPESLQAFFVSGIPVAETIENCDDLLKFQLIAKASSLYSKVQQEIINEGGLVEYLPVNRVNRVYASKNESLGSLYKTHGKTGRLEKIADLPEHCLVDNDNTLDIQQIDKDWYIQEAEKAVLKFIGEKPLKIKKKERKKMPKEKEPEIVPLNTRQKLMKARLIFQGQGVKKSGKNNGLRFMYFELSDIVPLAIRIFDSVGLVTCTEMDGDSAWMSVYNADNLDDEVLTFRVPYKESVGRYNKDGDKITDNMQDLGSTITYLCRYLWMLVLDVCEPDSIDCDHDIRIPQQEKRTAPPTQLERNQIKNNLTNPDLPADPLQVNALKNACKALKDAKPEENEFVQKIALKTNGFTCVTREQCEKLILLVDKRME